MGKVLVEIPFLFFYAHFAHFVMLDCHVQRKSSGLNCKCLHLLLLSVIFSVSYSVMCEWGMRGGDGGGQLCRAIYGIL